MARCVETIARESTPRLRKGGHSAIEAKRISTALQSEPVTRRVISKLRYQPGMVIAASALDGDPFTLNCRNGAIDLRSGKLKIHWPGDLLTKQCPIDFDANAKCPLWDAHLRTIFGNDEDLVGYLQRCAGLYASGDSTVQELHVWHGEGANGKSATYETIMHVLGDYASIAPEGLLVQRGFGVEHPTEIAGLLGKRLVIGSETKSDGVMRMDLIKRLTGDKVLKARFTYQDYFEFARTHKTVLVTNHVPRVAAAASFPCTRPDQQHRREAGRAT